MVTPRGILCLAAILIALFAPISVQVAAYTVTLLVVLTVATVRIGHRSTHPRARRHCR